MMGTARNLATALNTTLNANCNSNTSVSVSQFCVPFSVMPPFESDADIDAYVSVPNYGKAGGQVPIAAAISFTSFGAALGVPAALATNNQWKYELRGNASSITNRGVPIK